jgi:phosphopantetheine adenylyltransferase
MNFSKLLGRSILVTTLLVSQTFAGGLSAQQQRLQTANRIFSLAPESATLGSITQAMGMTAENPELSQDIANGVISEDQEQQAREIAEELQRQGLSPKDLTKKQFLSLLSNNEEACSYCITAVLFVVAVISVYYLGKGESSRLDEMAAARQLGPEQEKRQSAETNAAAANARADRAEAELKALRTQRRQQQPLQTQTQAGPQQ